MSPAGTRLEPAGPPCPRARGGHIELEPLRPPPAISDSKSAVPGRATVNAGRVTVASAATAAAPGPPAGGPASIIRRPPRPPLARATGTPGCRGQRPGTRRDRDHRDRSAAAAAAA